MPAVKRTLGASVVIVVGIITACSSLRLGETEQESVIISSDLPNNDFGSIQINSSSSPATVTISPAGSTSSSDDISMVASSSSEFIVTFPQGPPPQTVAQFCSGSGSGIGTSGGGTATSGCMSNTWSFQVTFAPTGTAGPRNATIHIIVDNVDQPITFSGNAVAPQYLIDASPQPLPFGYVKTATTSTDGTITVMNKGSQVLSISSLALDTAGGVFAYAIDNTGNTAPHTLAVGASETYSFTCTPAATTSYAGHFTITSNATNSPTLQIELDCTGTDSNLTTSPNPAKFPAMRVGDPAAMLSIAITNQSMTTPADIMVPTLSADTSPDLTIASYETGTLASIGPPLHVVLKYAPTTPVGTNGYLGTLIINYDNGKTYLATVFGEADPTAMSVSVGSIDFGPLCVGAPAVQHVTAYASDVGSFKVTDVSMPMTPFMRTMPSGESLPYVVQGNHQGNDFMFDVSITAPAAMMYASSLAITTDIPGKTPYTITLTAQGLPAGISPTPASVEFPPTPVDTTSSGQMVVLSNCGSGPIDVQSATVIGPDASEFAIALPTDPQKTLQIHDSEMFVLVMSPHSPGTKDATLVITYDSGSTSVPLDGNSGVAAGANKDRETYYACSTGRPAGWWPIGLALAWLARRRRRR